MDTPSTSMSSLPLPAPLAQADSLVGSLCREMDGLRRRWQQVRDERSRCRDTGLAQRLGAELSRLQQRRLELQRVAAQLRRQGLGDGLTLAFLGELTRRPLSA